MHASLRDDRCCFFESMRLDFWVFVQADIDIILALTASLPIHVEHVRDE
jgi:hypothetical protein